ARVIGIENCQAIDPADWMRIYFRHARAVYALCTQLLDETVPARDTSLVRGSKSRRSHSAFSVAGARLTVLEPAGLRDPHRLLEVFKYVAEHGIKLSREAEDQIR